MKNILKPLKKILQKTPQKSSKKSSKIPSKKIPNPENLVKNPGLFFYTIQYLIFLTLPRCPVLSSELPNGTFVVSVMFAFLICCLVFSYFFHLFAFAYPIAFPSPKFVVFSYFPMFPMFHIFSPYVSACSSSYMISVSMFSYWFSFRISSLFYMFPIWYVFVFLLVVPCISRLSLPFPIIPIFEHLPLWQVLGHCLDMFRMCFESFPGSFGPVWGMFWQGF